MKYRTRGCQNLNSSSPCYKTDLETKAIVAPNECIKWNSWTSYGSCYNGVQAKSKTCKDATSVYPTCNHVIETRSCLPKTPQGKYTFKVL